jgi:hypothetical protein
MHNLAILSVVISTTFMSMTGIKLPWNEARRISGSQVRNMPVMKQKLRESASIEE